MDKPDALAELWESLSRCPPGNTPGARLRRSQDCDRVLRLCVERLAQPGTPPPGAAAVVAVAEAACWGYLSAVPRPTPLYLEKILYHLLRNAAQRGSADGSRRAAELLRARLRTHPPGPAPDKDFAAIASSSFGVLWRAADALAEPEGPQEEGRAALRLRLWALRFLLLLERDGAPPPPLQPPFFASQTAQQAAAAAALYEAQQAPCPVFLGQQLGELLAVLREEAAEPPALQQSLCFFELTLERCRHLCKGGRQREAEDAVKDARGFLGTESFSSPLSLLEAGVQLCRALADGSAAGPPLARAALALGAGLAEPFLRVLAESAQFVASQLGDCAKRSGEQPPLGRDDVLDLCAFTEGHGRVLRRLLKRVPADSVKQQLMVKQLLFRSLQLFTSLAYDTFLCPQVLPMGDWPGLERLTSGCVRSVQWMLEGLGGLPDSEQTKYLDITASCTFKLAYIFYHQQLPAAADAVCEPLCASSSAAAAFARPDVPPDRLHKCFRLQGECRRRLGRLEGAVVCAARWLRALRGRGADLLPEPLALWVKLKTDAAKLGNEELRLRTLKDALEGHDLDADALVTVLFAELNAYKSVRADTGQERYNVLCDLLQICSEHSGRLHQRAVALTELAQVLCHRSYAPYTDCSSLDSVREALRLLELVPRSAQNRDQLLDDQAQALLWLFICSLESNLEKSIERDQRAKAQVLKNLEDFEPNDLKYDGRALEERFLYDGLSFDLATDAALSQNLDDAFALWKQLLGTPGVPAVRSPEQTVTSLRLLAALYTLMAKPLQAMESYLLLRALCGALGDNLGTASALCHVTKLLFQLECPSYAQLFLKESESYLQKADGGDDSYPLLRQRCLLLRSQLCLVTQRVEEGLLLLLEVLQDLAAQKVTKFWYLLRAHVLQLVAMYLSLPPTRLSPRLRQRVFAHGWKTPATALVEAQKLFRSLIYLLMGSEVLGGPTPAPDRQPADCGDNVLLKWQVLGDALACSERLVALLGQLDVMCQAKAFCLDAAKLAMKLQAVRWCASFLVLKAQLGLRLDELELSSSDLQQVLFLLEPGGEFKPSKKEQSQPRILPRRGKPERTQPPATASELPREDDAFLEGPALNLVPVQSGLAAADALTASPELKPARKRSPAFLSHPPRCSCSLCSDPVLSALCLRWLLSHARAELAAGAGAAAAGLALLCALPGRCAAAAARFAAVLRQRLRGERGDGRPPAPELLDDVTAAAYAALALQSLASPRRAQELRQELETGLRFVASRSPHLPGLGGAWAVLLLAKATATVWHLAAERGGSADAVFAGVWACHPVTPAPAEPDAAPLPQTQKPDKAQPRRCRNKAAVAPVVPKPRARKTPRAKALAVLNTDDAFALGDSDGEVPPIVIRPVSAACTPRPKARPTPKTRGVPKTPFTIFSDSPQAAGKSRLLRAPRVSGRAKSRLKVTFSDDSDSEAPEAALTPKSCCARRGRPPKSQASSPQNRRGQAGARRGPRAGAEVERELLRAIEEEEKAEEELEISFEVMRASEEEEGAPGRRRLEGADGEHEVLGTSCEDPLCPKGSAVSTLLMADDVTLVIELLTKALNCISHCPPGALYGHVCRLLALATGNRDPLRAAYLLAESVAVTARHQLLGVTHRKMCKEKRPAGDVAEQLQGLSLREGSTAPRSPPPAELERLFAFSPAALGPEVPDGFREQLRRIPGGVTVCVLALVGARLGSAGDTLLLTRLEKDAGPVTIRIPTAGTETPLSSVLSDFDAIQKEQKQWSACTDKQEWWLRRSELDRRMKSLIETLETRVLGCWRGVLLPAAPDAALPEDTGRLHAELRGCGWRDADPALLRVLLNAAPLLGPEDVRAVAFGLCAGRPREAQRLLQEALEKRRAKQSGGSLVLVLDKHLQKLPWESMACLRAVPVTRLPSLRFLLSYSLARERGGSVLSRGVSPSSAFYVLNPHKNLPGTQERFQGWFESIPGWKGVIGAIPSAEQIQAALRDHDLYIYAGHGAGACFLDGQSISRLSCRAVALLFGCSSAALALRGDLEGFGIVLSYILAGCPLVLGNLWDVTDRDIDRYARALLEGWLGGGAGAPLLFHVAQARQAPKLKYLIGAAPIAYGLPVCLQ